MTNHSSRYDRSERYAHLDDEAPGVRTPKSAGKERRQGTLTNLHVYGSNLGNGARARLERLERRCPPR